MPRVHHRKARKDYPSAGIKAGDMYYTASIKTGPRSSRTIRSLKPIPRSQLTTSAFLSGWYAVQEGIEGEALTADVIRDCASTIRELGEAAMESYENMPEGLQEGETGQLLYARAEGSETTADELGRVADELDDLEEPIEEAFDPSDYAEEMSEMDPEDVEEFLADMEAQHDDDYQNAVSEYETDEEALLDEARELIDDIPEY